jgi:hypothetical protein
MIDRKWNRRFLSWKDSLFRELLESDFEDDEINRKREDLLTFYEDETIRGNDGWDMNQRFLVRKILDENKRESEGVNNMFLVIDDLIRYMKGINEIIDMYSKKDIKSLEGIVKKYRDTKIIERSDKRLLKHILYKGIGDIKLIIPNLDYYVDNCL